MELDGKTPQFSRLSQPHSYYHLARSDDELGSKTKKMVPSSEQAQQMCGLLTEEAEKQLKGFESSCIE